MKETAQEALGAFSCFLNKDLIKKICSFNEKPKEHLDLEVKITGFPCSVCCLEAATLKIIKENLDLGGKLIDFLYCLLLES